MSWNLHLSEQHNRINKDNFVAKLLWKRKIKASSYIYKNKKNENQNVVKNVGHFRVWIFN